ncbi:MAG: glycosyltransferase [Chloroflexota bacterium]|nr:glycosyltransferase [Chloroflexota bacterium]
MLIWAIYLVLGFFAMSLIRVVAISVLSFTYLRRRPPLSHLPAPPQLNASWPSVVVQLPVYREHTVLDRLLAAVVKMEYPAGLMVVQVLDDSEEREASVAAEIVGRYRNGPVRVEYVHRAQRTGYKSGALNYGLRMTYCDLIAIFDADFIPRPDFLLKTVPLFQDEKVGGVHTRWSHLNDWESPLTMMQAAVLDTLFCFENGIRQAMGESSMYLGTSGVWRKSVVEKVGGWNEGLFTDDGIDMSYRAQLGGWSVAYVDEPLSSSELPDTYLAYKSQQRRWARAALRLFMDYWRYAFTQERSKRSVGSRLLEVSLLHLVFSTPFLLLAALFTGIHIVLGLPRSTGWLAAQLALTGVLLLFPPAIEVLLSQKLLYRDWPRRCLFALRALPLAIGLSVSVLAGFIDTIKRSRAEFVTTPKQGAEAVVQSSKERWLQTAERIAGVELLIALLSFAALILAVVRGYPESGFLFLWLSGAFLVAGGTSVREIWRMRARLQAQSTGVSGG